MNKKCQVFTPKDYVEKLLDSIGYTRDLYGKTILENSCGDGNILSIIVQRYINDCKQKGISRTRIRNGLSKDICGVEIDPEQYEKCINKLNEIVKKNNILPVKWNIKNVDYLKTNDDEKFDFIVGNPPYVTYRELSKADQTYLKDTFKSCEKGKFDYCYAFIEKSIRHLAKKGKMAYLVPSSIFKTVSGEKLRKMILPYLVLINDYTQETVFKDALIKSAIVLMTRDVLTKEIHYVDETTGIKKRVSRDQLGKKWNFANEKHCYVELKWFVPHYGGKVWFIDPDKNTIDEMLQNLHIIEK